MITKAMISVTKNDSHEFLVNKVLLLPAIKQKWPVEEFGEPIFIQQDNAKTHIDVNDVVFKEAATADGFDIRLMYQPPNSPDLNALDLGLFSGIKSIFQNSAMNSKHKHIAEDIMDLVFYCRVCKQCFRSQPQKP